MTGKEQEELKKQFHPAFCDAMTQIFAHDVCEYEYEREYNLNSMPNRIDFLIIKKRLDAVSGKGMGKIFRKYNLFEYKSPGQELGTDAYHLLMAYAYLYTAYEKDVAFEEITLSFVREGKPARLMGYFEDHGFQIVRPESGIYHLRKNDHPDMQMIVTRELGEEYIWLKVLTDRLTREDAVRLAGEAAKEQDAEGRTRVCSILDLVSLLNRNKEWMKEMKGMGAFRDLFKEEFEEKDHKIAEQMEQIQNLSQRLKSKDDQLQSKDEQLQSKDAQLQSKDEQLQSKDEQLQSKDEQLQSQNEQLKTEQEENHRLRKEIEDLKKQMGRIAVL